MVKTVAKTFEERFKEDWIKSFPNSFIMRIPDQVSMKKETSKNVCDFVCYNQPTLFLVECKSHKEASIPFTKIPQYERMIEFVGITGVRAGVVLWLRDKDRVFYIPISTIKKMKEDGQKSVGLRSLKEGYKIIEIPSTKRRVYMESDYSCLMFLEDGE